MRAIAYLLEQTYKKIKSWLFPSKRDKDKFIY